MYSTTFGNYMQFIADTMLGKLAKWLRFMGYDVLYPKDMEDKGLVELSRTTDRILLTRDKELAKIKDLNVLYIQDENIEIQLKQLINEFKLSLTGNEFSRCPECNQILNDFSKSQLVEKKDIDKIPTGVFDRHDFFWFCGSCDKYYWRGTHYQKIREKINELLQ